MPKKTILLVDDDELTRDVLFDCFEPHLDVICAHDGLDAMRIYKEQRDKISLVLTDWKMPRLDGIELIKWLLDTSSTVPVFLMTGFTDDEQVYRFRNIDRVRVIAKPFDFDELTQLVMNRIGV